MGDVVLSQQANPGTAGANMAVVYVNLSNQPCFTLSDGIERPLMTANAPVAVGSVNPGTNGVPSLGTAGLGFKELFLDYTITPTVGNVTINKASGRAIVANAATSVTVTNNLVTANTCVIAVAAANDSTGWVKNVVSNSGNFVVTCNAPSANMPINFLVMGAD